MERSWAVRNFGLMSRVGSTGLRIVSWWLTVDEISLEVVERHAVLQESGQIADREPLSGSKRQHGGGPKRKNGIFLFDENEAITLSRWKPSAHTLQDSFFFRQQ